ncbi:MAG: hypothetical protein WAW73_18130 [Rhodoferax sp.]
MSIPTSNPVFSLDKSQRDAFAVDNRLALELLISGTDDYIGCRCCLLHGAFAGLALGATAVEKHLKAMIRLKSPATAPRGYSHKMLDLADAVQALGVVDLQPYRDTLTRLADHYHGRYPDNPRQLDSYSTSELAEIDTLMAVLIEQMPLPTEMLLRTGIPAKIASMAERNPTSPELALLLNRNQPLQALARKLECLHTEWAAFNGKGKKPAAATAPSGSGPGLPPALTSKAE